MIFSVIVPFLNEEAHIEQCIKALLEQDFDKNEYELIFVDNGSADRSKDIVRRFPHVILLQESKKSSYAARNRGLKVAQGEIIAFTDADCAVSRNWLTQVYEGMRKTKAAIALGKRCFPLNSSFSLRMFEDYENAKVEYVLGKCAEKYFFGFTNNMAVEAEVFKKVGFFVEYHRGGDIEFLHRFISQNSNSKVVYLDGMKTTHLEITNLKSWLKKINIYGEYNRLIEEVADYSKLDYKVKLQIYNYCVNKNNYTFWQKILLILLLIIGDLSYRIGRIRGYIKSR